MPRRDRNARPDAGLLARGGLTWGADDDLTLDRQVDAEGVERPNDDPRTSEDGARCLVGRDVVPRGTLIATRAVGSSSGLSDALRTTPVAVCVTSSFGDV